MSLDIVYGFPYKFHYAVGDFVFKNMKINLF